MPKKDISKRSGRVSAREEKLRQELVDELFTLKTEWFNHMKEALGAEVECAHCYKKDGTYYPGKAVDSQGKCNFCHNTGIVPDKSQRNWAANQLGLRLAPAPKAVEVSVEETDDGGEIEKTVKKLDPVKLKVLFDEFNNTS